MAIYDYKYRGFHGKVGGRLDRIWTVFAAEFAFRMKNVWMIMLLVLTLALGVFPSIMMMEPLGFFFYLFVWATLYTAVAGGDILSSDRKYNTVTLYFSRPITKDDYFAGKFLTLYTIISLVCLLPCLIMIMMIYGIGEDVLTFDVAPAARGFLVLGLLWNLLFTAIAMGFSSTTTNQWFATVGTFAFLFISSLLGGLFSIFIHRDFGYLNINTDLSIMLNHFGGFEQMESYYRWEPALAAILLMSGFFLALAYMQTKRMDLSE